MSLRLERFSCRAALISMSGERPGRAAAMIVNDTTQDDTLGVDRLLQFCAVRDTVESIAFEVERMLTADRAHLRGPVEPPAIATA